MGVAIALRDDFDGPGLRRLARAAKDAGQSRRCLALAEIYDGGARSDAAWIGGVGLQVRRGDRRLARGRRQRLRRSRLLAKDHPAGGPDGAAGARLGAGTARDYLRARHGAVRVSCYHICYHDMKED